MNLSKKIALLTALVGSALLNVAIAGKAIDNGVLAKESNGADWAGFGRTFSEQRFSPLKQIDADNVSRLGLAWSMDLPDVNFSTTAPLAVDGVIFFSPGVSEVRAVSATTGKLLWRYDPEVVKFAPKKMRAGWGSRGLAYWDGKVFLGARDGRLIALNAKTGKPVWSAMTVGIDDQRYVSGAPRVFNSKVIIGHGGADYGPTRGYVTAYDARTGKQLWRFFTVPGNPADGFENKAMEMAAKTWKGEWWKHGGGGTVWNAMTYDPVFNRIYLGTGNGAPWNQKIRSPGGGDNLFLSSIVALDADTGEYAWHYQTNPGESWDYNSSMDMVLADVAIDGKKRQVILHAPKNGFFYVIDRADGKLISADKFTRVTWADRIDLSTGRPVEAAGARLPDGEALIWPGMMGGHNWQPMSYNPATGLVYIPTLDLPGYYNDKGIDSAAWKHREGTTWSPGFNDVNEDTPMNAGSSSLQAWDPVQKKAVWSVPTPGLMNGGTITTAGNLVFQGQVDGKFIAYAADTGKRLWSFEAGNAVMAPPITFSVGKTQYVAVLTGNGGAPSVMGSPQAQFGWQSRGHVRRLLTFALDGKSKLAPVPTSVRFAAVDDPQVKIDPALAAKGKALFFEKSCAGCHGFGAVAAGGAPDLRGSALALSLPGFTGVVRDGILQSKGMPRYEELNDEALESLYHYIRSRARETLAAPVVGK